MEGLPWAAHSVGDVVPSTLSRQEISAQQQGGTRQRWQSWDSDLGPRNPSILPTPRVTMASLCPLPLKSDKEQ